MSSNAQLLYLKGVYSNAGYKHSAIVSSVVDRFEQIMPFSQFQIFQKSYFQKISNAKDFFQSNLKRSKKNFKGQTLLLPKVLFKKENWSQIINPANPVLCRSAELSALEFFNEQNVISEVYF